MTRPVVSILMGSDSDLETMKGAVEVLDHLSVPCEAQVLSAHRSPHLVAEFAEKAKAKGIKVIICGAGGAAHLAGVVAAHTTLPVIGVPINSSALNGLDSLLSTVQMPSGIPVATVAIGKSGAANAGILAAQILALSDKKLAAKLATRKADLTRSVQEKNERLRKLMEKRKS